MSDSTKAPAPPKPKSEKPAQQPPEAGWQEEWSEEVPLEPQPEQVWEHDEDTSDGDTDWEDEDLLSPDTVGDVDEEGWAPTEGDWEDVSDWDDAIPDEPEHADPFDDLPDAPSIVGWKTRVDLPGYGVAELPARCSTDCSTSTFHTEVHPGEPGHVRLKVQGAEFEVPVTDESGELVIQLTLMVSDKTFPLDLRIRATSGAPLLVLGRDALAGRFLIDVAG